MPQLLFGAPVQARILDSLKPRIRKLSRPPGLAVVLVDHDPASEIYVRRKIDACAANGVFSEKIAPPNTATTEDLIEIVEGLNRRADIDGILIQMPLPKQVDWRRVVQAVDIGKDADGLHPTNVGLLVEGSPAPRSCTPAGIVEMLKFYNVPMAGRSAVVLGRSDIVGKPMALMLLEENATVTICHSRTENLAEVCRRADILVSAIGRAAFVTSDFICPGATVVDVGVNRVTNRALAVQFGREEQFDARGQTVVGDVHPVDVARIASAYTPVPGGVGPLTIAMLMTNTVALAEQRQNADRANAGHRVPVGHQGVA